MYQTFLFDRCIPEATELDLDCDRVEHQGGAKAIVDNIVKYFPNLKKLELQFWNQCDIEWFIPLKNLTHLKGNIVSHRLRTDQTSPDQRVANGHAVAYTIFFREKKIPESWVLDDECIPFV